MPRQVAVSAGYGSLNQGNFIPEIWSMKMQAGKPKHIKGLG